MSQRYWRWWVCAQTINERLRKCLRGFYGLSYFSCRVDISRTHTPTHQHTERESENLKKPSSEKDKSKRSEWVWVHVSSSMWQMWCRLIGHDCWQAAGNSLLCSKSSGEPLCGEGGRPKIIALYLITLHMPPLTSTQKNHRTYKEGFLRVFWIVHCRCMFLIKWIEKTVEQGNAFHPSNISEKMTVVYHSRLYDCAREAGWAWQSCMSAPY